MCHFILYYDDIMYNAIVLKVNTIIFFSPKSCDHIAI